MKFNKLNFICSSRSSCIGTRTNVRATNVRETNVRATNVRETNVRLDKRQTIQTSEWYKGQTNLAFCKSLTFFINLKNYVCIHCFGEGSQV